MGTQRSATVYITNNSGGNAWIFLCHNNSRSGTQRGSWTAAPGQTVGPLTVYFETGFGAWGIHDNWSVLIHVQDGPAPGFYVSRGTDVDPYWQDCKLRRGDAGKTLTFSVSTTGFDIDLQSGRSSDGMTKLAPYSPITHVFVVMLENHSFDNIFAMSGIPGIKAATTNDFNTYNTGTKIETYHVQPSAPLSLPADPGHEFLDVVEQLTGQGAYPPGGPYPPINNSGFASNYAASTTGGKTTPQPNIGDVMACFATQTQLPALYQLATQYALCDQWHSSIPGPTWPNRFFVHGASSAGLDTSPSTDHMLMWEFLGEGFKYPNGSIYDALNKAGIPYRFYNDSTGAPLEHSLYSDVPENGSPIGAVPQVASLYGVSLLDINSLKNFATDLQGPYPYLYTFIEPHYGDIVSGSYAGGSSQHPMDDVYGGEHLLASVYSAIRNSPYWNTSLLIITYDEHGGLYDSVAPGSAPAPGDNPADGWDKYGFNFELYGVRVPAVIVSPLIPAGTLDHTLYDHSSIPKTVEHLFGLLPLTKRDAGANSVLRLLSLTTPRADCPVALNLPAPLLKAAKPPMTAEERVQRDAQPVPQAGNLVGALYILKKTEHELHAETPLKLGAVSSGVETIQTQGQVQDYAAAVMEKVGKAREQRKHAARRKP